MKKLALALFVLVAALMASHVMSQQTIVGGLTAGTTGAGSVTMNGGGLTNALNEWMSNATTHATYLRGSNAHYQYVDPYKTTNEFYTNYVRLTWTNGNSIILSNDGRIYQNGIATPTNSVSTSNLVSTNDTRALNLTNSANSFGGSGALLTSIPLSALPVTVVSNNGAFSGVAAGDGGRGMVAATAAQVNALFPGNIITNGYTPSQLSISNTSGSAQATLGPYVFAGDDVSGINDAGLNLITYGGTSNSAGLFRAHTARGTASTPTALSANDYLFTFSAAGHDGTAFSPSSDASIELHSGPFTTNSHPTYISFLTTASGSTSKVERARIATNGLFTIAQKLRIENNAGSSVVTPGYVADVIVNSASADDGLSINYYGSGTPDPELIFRTARGSAGSPSAIQSGDSMGLFGGRGYMGASGFTTGSKVAMVFEADENWSASANGTHIRFVTTPDGSTSGANRIRIEANGNVNVVSGNLGASGVTSGTNGLASYRSNLVACTSITLGASPANWTNTLSPACNVVVYVDGLSVTGTVGINGSTIFNSIAQNTILLGPNEYTTVTFTIGTPTACFKPR